MVRALGMLASASTMQRTGIMNPPVFRSTDKERTTTLNQIHYGGEMAQGAADNLEQHQWTVLSQE